jgi:hypothetical protein
MARRKRISDTLDWQQIEGRLEANFTAATTAQRADGAEWYGAANGIARQIADASFPPITTRCAAGIIAALSPQADWDSNVRQAIEFGSGAEISNTDDRIGKATECRDGADPSTVLRGPKESAFFECIANPKTARSACIDRHMVRAALAVDTDREIRLWIGRAGVYDGIAECIARIADRHDAPIPEVQATIWNVIRDPRQGIDR